MRQLPRHNRASKRGILIQFHEALICRRLGVFGCVMLYVYHAEPRILTCLVIVSALLSIHDRRPEKRLESR